MTGMDMVIILYKALPDRLFQGKSKDDRTEKIENSFCPFFIILPDRCCGQSKTELIIFRWFVYETWSAEVVSFIGYQEAWAFK